jgi:uncharacterized protein YqgC (DUF456 family)
MDIALQIIAGLFMVAGILGGLLPFLPGPPLSYAGLLLLQVQTHSPFTIKFLIVWAVITVAVTILDYVVPIWGTRKWGGTNYGMWGSAIGLLAGFWFGPVGIIAGPFLGALIGEIIGHQDSDRAMKAAIGSFCGFMIGTVAKLIVSTMMFYYYIVSL